MLYTLKFFFVCNIYVCSCSTPSFSSPANFSHPQETRPERSEKMLLKMWTEVCEAEPLRAAASFLMSKHSTHSDRIIIKIVVILTSVQSNLANGRIAVLSPIAAANAFLCRMR